SEQEMVLAIRRNNQSVTNEYLDFWACDSNGVKLGEPLSIALPDSQFSTDIKLVTLGESFYAVYSYGNLGWPDTPLQIWMTAFTTSDILPAKKSVAVPEVIALSAWPNPFNSRVSIEYSLSAQAHVTLSVYDILGRHVETLLQETQMPGVHHTHWHAGHYASGTYFIRLENLSARAVQKIMLIR
ncbi:T9SS type A sorting domain-containing protein, partial [bacterium]|nr:T9SS type A sorting domain-containing protein [bacterium]